MSVFSKQIARGHLISLPPHVYERAILAALKEQDKLWGTNAAGEYADMPEDEKKKLQKVWMTGFTALLRAWL